MQYESRLLKKVESCFKHGKLKRGIYEPFTVYHSFTAYKMQSADYFLDKLEDIVSKQRKEVIIYIDCVYQKGLNIGNVYDTMAEFELYKDKAGEWRWRFRANNGKIIADSGEGYKNKQDCKHGIELIKEQTPDANIEEI